MIGYGIESTNVDYVTRCNDAASPRYGRLVVSVQTKEADMVGKVIPSASGYNAILIAEYDPDNEQYGWASVLHPVKKSLRGLSYSPDCSKVLTEH